MNEPVLLKSKFLLFFLLLIMNAEAQIGSALNFDGVDDHISTALPMTVTDNFTLESWIYPSVISGVQVPVSYGFNDGVTENGLALALNEDSLQVYFAGVGLFNCGYIFPATDQWYHIALVRSSGTTSIYVNGVLAPNTSTQSVSTPTSFIIGSQNGIRFFNGQIDEIRLWNIALTQSEIASRMNCEISVAKPELVANYHFNQGLANDDNTSPAINTLSDASGNSHSGTLVNFSLNGSVSNWVSPSAISSGTFCDSLTYYFDGDNDGYGNILINIFSNSQPLGYVTDSTDCNDGNPTIFPGAIEIADNGIDDDCNGSDSSAYLTPIFSSIGSSPDFANGLSVNNGKVYVCGHGLNSLVGAASYFDFTNLALTPTQFYWPLVSNSLDNFNAVTSTSEGVYFAGYSNTQVAVPSSYTQEVTVKFPLSGATGSGVGGCDWNASPLSIQSVNEHSEQTKIISAIENGVNYIYSLGTTTIVAYNYQNNLVAATLTKFDTIGNIVWKKEIVGSLAESYLAEGYGKTLTKVGQNIFVVCQVSNTSYFGSSTYYSLFKIDEAGNNVNSINMMTGYDPRDMVSANGYLYLCRYNSVMKFDTDLNLIWDKFYDGTSNYQELTSIAIAPCCDKLFVGGSAGSLYGPNYNSDALLLTINLQNGDLISSEKFGGGNEESISDMDFNGTDLFITGNYHTYYDTLVSPTTTIIGGVDLADINPEGSFVVKINTLCAAPALPNCSNLIFPSNDTTFLCNQDSIKLRWDGGSNCEINSKLFFGTDNPPTNIYNGIDLGNTFTKQLPILSPNTTYYWSIKAYNGSNDATGCSVFHFTTGNSVSITSISNNTPLCYGDTLHLFATASPSNVTYLWTANFYNYPYYFESTLQNPVIDHMSFFSGGEGGSSNIGNINLTVTDSLGCSISAFLSDTIGGQVIEIYKNYPICGGGYLNLYTYNDTSIINSYLWAGPNSFSFTGPDTTISPIDTSYSGNYSVTVIFKDGCSVSTNLNVEVNPEVTAQIISDSSFLTTNPIQLNASAINYDYLQWYGGDGSFDNSSILNPIYTPGPNDIYNKTVTFYLSTQSYTSSCNAFDQLTVTFEIFSTYYHDVDADGFGNINDTLIRIFQPVGYVSDSTDCNDTNALINPYTTWAIDQDGDGYGSGIYFTQCLTPPYGYLVGDLVNSYGDCNDTNAAIVLPPIVSFTGLPTSVCSSDPIILTGSPSGGVFSGIGVSGNTFTPSAAGYFTITYNYSINGCSASESHSIDVLAPAATITCNSPVCNAGTLTINATGGTTYNWTGPNGFSASGSSVVIPNVTPADTGVYSVNISSAACPQIVTKSVNVSVTIKQPSFFTGLNAEYCMNGAPSILSGAPSGGTFSGAGMSGNTFYPNSAGTLTITYVAPTYLGCAGDIITQTTLVRPAPSITITSSAGNVLCPGVSTILTAISPSTNLLWSTGSTSTNFTTNIAGTYIVTVTDNNNCSASATKIISKDVVPQILTSNGTSICPGETDTLTYNTLFKLWSTGANTTSIVVSPAVTTLYKVTGTSAAGCIYKDSVKINVTPLVAPGAVTNMLPTNNLLNLNFPITLSWLPGSNNTKFDIYIWADTLPQPVTPYQSDVLSIGIILQKGSLDYGVKYNWRVVSKNGNCFSTNGSIQSFSIRTLPDLTAQITTAQYSINSNFISWLVHNEGTGTTGNDHWSDAIYISADTILQLGTDDYLGARSNVSALLSGQSYSNSFSLQNLSYSYAGNYYLIVYTDAYNQMLEESDSNNVNYFVTPITIIPQPKPDLRVTSVINQNNAFSGDRVNVTFTVKNFGEATAYGYSLVRNIPVTITYTFTTNYNSNYIVSSSNFSKLWSIAGWSDKLGISDQPFLTIPSTLDLIHPPISKTIYENYKLGLNNNYSINYYNNGLPGHFQTYEFPIVPNSGGDYDNSIAQLPPDSSYTVTKSIAIPKHVFGQYYIFAKTDNTNHIDEGPLDNNNQNSNLINVFLKPPPDLVVSSITAPTSAASGQSIAFNYSVMNQGFTPPDTSYWYDEVYMSAIDSFDLINAFKVEKVFCTQTIGPGSSYSKQLNIVIPDALTSGNYYFYVKTDASQSVFEYTNEENNILRSDTTIFISNPDLQVSNVSCVDSIFSGATITIKWNVVNAGIGGVYDKWSDNIFLSHDSVFNSNTAVQIGSTQNSVTLQGSDTLAKQKVITLPQNIVGDYYVFVYTDFGDVIFESNNENNNVNAVVPAIHITQSALPDLAVISLVSSDTIRGMSSALVNITISNLGDNDVNATWWDSLYISKKASWDRDSAVAVAGFFQSRLLQVADSYTINQTVSIPNTDEIPNGNNNSPFYFYVYTDATNKVYEGNNEINNIYRTNNSVVVSYLYVDHVVTGVASADSAFAGQPFAIDWTVKNLGHKPNWNYYHLWEDGFYLSTDTVLSGNDYFIGSRSISIPLQTDSTYSKQKQFTITNGLVGNYYLLGYTNYNDKILAESNRSNNYNLKRSINGNPKSIYIVTLPPPDLEITINTAPTQSQAGQPGTINYTVKNIGTGITLPNHWRDKLYLSTDFIIDGNDEVLVVNPSNNSLEPDSSYTDNIQFNLPQSANGNYILILKTDNNETVFEGNSESNNLEYSYITINQPPPCDLVVSNITNPDSAFTSQQITIEWQMQNNGDYPATGINKETVYFSKDAVWSVDDVLFGTLNNNINIPPGSSENHSLTAYLTTAPLGFHFVIVRADLLNNIIESNDSNNITTSASQLYVGMKQLALNTITPDTIATDTLITTYYSDNLGNYSIDSYYDKVFLYYHIEIPDSLSGQSLRIKLIGNTGNHYSKILLASFNKVPSGFMFDYVSANPDSNNQEIIVPSIDSGSYYISVHFRSAYSQQVSEPITLYADIIPFEIRIVDSKKGGNTGNVTVKMTGSQFVPNMQAHLLSNTSSLDIQATMITYVNSTTLYATFNLNQKPLGIYDVLLKKPDSTTAILDNGFEIEKGNTGTFYVGGISNTGMTGSPDAPGCDPGSAAGINSSLQFQVNCPTTARIGRVVPMTIIFGNAGNVDIPLPTRILSGTFINDSNGPPVGLNVTDLTQNQQNLYLEFREPGGPPNVLRAGASSGITVYTKTVRRGRVNFKLK